MLTFDLLRAANVARLPLFKNKHGNYAHNELDGSDWSISDWVEALLGELGEFANGHKKLRRGDMTPEEFQDYAAKEVADVMIYLDLLAYQLRIDLGEATVAKFNEVSDRVDAPVHLLRLNSRLMLNVSGATPRRGDVVRFVYRDEEMIGRILAHCEGEWVVQFMDGRARKIPATDFRATQATDETTWFENH